MSRTLILIRRAVSAVVKQPPRTFIIWVLVGALAGLHTAAVAGFLDVNGQFSAVDFPGAIGVLGTQPTDINNTGQIVGSYTRGSGWRGFLDVAGTFSTISVPGSIETYVRGVNDAGHIVGYFYSRTGAGGFLDVEGTFSAVEVPGSFSTTPTGINNAGHIVGYFNDSTGFTHGFLRVGDTTTALSISTPIFSAAGVSTHTVALGINDADDIVGYFDLLSGSYGFLCVHGTCSDINVPGASYTRPTGIDNAGHVVGYFGDSTGAHGFLYKGGTFSDVDVPGAIETFAYGINDAGHIVGYPSTSTVPEMSTLLAFCIGALGLGFACRRKFQSSEDPKNRAKLMTCTVALSKAAGRL